MLQWGRNLTVAEGVPSYNAQTGANLELQWGRNLTVAEGVPSYNAQTGANLELQWGRNLTVAEGLERADDRDGGGVASMGPQLDSCGRGLHMLGGVFQIQLQWGRNLTVAEGARPGFAVAVYVRFNGAAT